VQLPQGSRIRVDTVPHVSATNGQSLQRRMVEDLGVGNDVIVPGKFDDAWSFVSLCSANAGRRSTYRR
jgi:hypothetical protein